MTNQQDIRDADGDRLKRKIQWNQKGQHISEKMMNSSCDNEDAEMVVLLENEKSAVLDSCTVSRGVTMCLQNDEDFSFRKIVGLTPPVVRGVSKVPKN